MKQQISSTKHFDQKAPKITKTKRNIQEASPIKGTLPSDAQMVLKTEPRSNASEPVYISQFKGAANTTANGNLFTLGTGERNGRNKGFDSVSSESESEGQMKAVANIFQSDEESPEDEEYQSQEGEELEEYEEEDEEADAELANQEELEKYVKNFQEEIEIKFNASEVNRCFKMPRDVEYSESSSGDSSLLSIREATVYDLEEQNIPHRDHPYGGTKREKSEKEPKASSKSPERNQRIISGFNKKVIDEHGNIHLSNEDLRNDELSVLTALNILENVENVAFASVSAKLKDKNSPLYHALYKIVEENMKKSEPKQKDEAALSPEPKNIGSKSPPLKTHKKQTKSGSSQVFLSQNHKKEADPTIKGATKLEIKKINPKNERSSTSSQHPRRQPSNGKGGNDLRYVSREEPKPHHEAVQSSLRTVQNHSHLVESPKQNSRDAKVPSSIYSSGYHFPRAIQKQYQNQPKTPGKTIGNLSYYKGNLNLDNSGDEKRPGTLGTGALSGALSYGSKPPTPSAKEAVKRIAKQEMKPTKKKPFNFQEEQLISSEVMKSLKSSHPTSSSIQVNKCVSSSQHVANLLKTVQDSSMRARGTMKNRREKMISSNAAEIPTTSTNFKGQEGIKVLRPQQHQINTTKQSESNTSMPNRTIGDNSNASSIQANSFQGNQIKNNEKSHNPGMILLGGSSANSLRSNESSGSSSLDRASKKNAKGNSGNGAVGVGNYSKLNSHLLSKLKNTANFGKTVKQNMRNSTKTTATPSTVNPSFNYNPGLNYPKGASHGLGKETTQVQGKATQRKTGDELGSHVEGKKGRNTEGFRNTETFKKNGDFGNGKGGKSPNGPVPMKMGFQNFEYL